MESNDELLVYLLFLNFSNQQDDSLPIQLLKYLNEQSKREGFADLQAKAKVLRRRYKQMGPEEQHLFKQEQREKFKADVQQILQQDVLASRTGVQQLQESTMNQIQQSRLDQQKIELLSEACSLLRCSEESLLEYLKQLLQCRQCLKHVSKSLGQCKDSVLEQRQLIVTQQSEFRKFLKESFKQACILTGRLETAACQSLKELSCKRYYFNISQIGYVLDQFTVQINGVERVFDGVFSDFSQFSGAYRGKLHFAGAADLQRSLFKRICDGSTMLRSCRVDGGKIEDLFGRQFVDHRIQLAQVRFQQEEVDKIFGICSRAEGAVIWAEEQNCYMIMADFVNESAIELMRALGISGEYECVHYIGK